MSFVKIWVHLVWATKNRSPFLETNFRQKLFDHIRNYANSKGITIDHINGYSDHIHCLISLNSDQNISTIANLLKGESSFWINKNNLTRSKFSWQNDYFAASISHSQVDRVRGYIRQQEEHHRVKSFREEYDEFISKYGFYSGSG